MSIPVTVYVEDPSDPMDDGLTTLRLYSDTSPTGAFSTLVGTATLALTTHQYTITDASGTVDTWYRYTFYLASPSTETPMSEPFKTEGASLLYLRINAAREAGAGWDGTCSAVGTTSALVDTVMADSGIDEHFIEGSWVYRPDAAAAADKVRRVLTSGWDPDTGTLTPSRAWTNAPASGEVYQIFNLAPPIDTAGSPYSWDRAVRSALLKLTYPDMLTIGEGDGIETRFSLSAFLSEVDENDVLGIYRRTTDSNDVVTDINARMQGGIARFIRNGASDVKIEVIPPPITDESVVISVRRRGEAMYKDDDVTLVPFERAWRAVVYEMYRWMNGGGSNGRYAAELSFWEMELRQYERETNSNTVVVLA